MNNSLGKASVNQSVFYMIQYNFDRLFKARGITKPFTFLKQSGFSDKTASKIFRNKVKRLNLRTIEKLCLALNCTPDSFYEWIPDEGSQIDANHALNKIKPTKKIVDIGQMLHSVPLNKLSEVERILQNAIDEG